MKGLRTNKLDFEIIETNNIKTLVFLDSSEYIHVPENPLLDIVLPGHNKYFTVNIIQNTVNTFNSNTIGLTHLLKQDYLHDLPDGVYSFRYRICPYDKIYVEKKYFRTVSLEHKLNEVYCKLNEEAIKESSETLVEISVLLEGAKRVVNCDSDKAESFYKLANSLITKLINNKC